MKILINNIINTDEISSIVISELKELGIKYRKTKKNNKIQPDKLLSKRIFNTHLNKLELTDAVLSNGGVVQVPKFIYDACQRILENVEIEGIFRKAGSTIRQKELRTNIESGLPLEKNYHVIDIANILKSFFRELPEPLLPNYIHETLIRCLLITNGNRINAILMSLLLLPTLVINTLAFFMEFLYTIAENSHLNKMSIDNLSIIFTPGLMPSATPNKLSSGISGGSVGVGSSGSISGGIRFNNHVKVIKILIENASMIGVIPDNIIKKMNLSSGTGISSTSSSLQDILITSNCQNQKDKEKETKKKKKRRSGSLTRMFNGLRKIVGAIGSSSENLEDTPISLNYHQTNDDNNFAVGTPCLSKSAKKRKLNDHSGGGFSAKKRKEILDFLPPENGGILPNTPHCLKEIKKSRLSLGGKKNFKYPSLTTSSDKRWSIVGSNWTRKKDLKVKNDDDNESNKKSKTKNQHKLKQILPSVSSMPCILDINEILSSSSSVSLHGNSEEKERSEEVINEKWNQSTDNNDDYVRIPKSEYEAIKERVAAIETRISQEFGTITKSLYNNSLSSTSSSVSPTKSNLSHLSGPEKVLNKFEKTIEETENMISSLSTSSNTSPVTADHLAKRLSRELKIHRRRSSESRIPRSPSQRKIGSIRRRSRENVAHVRLTRNKTWHITNSTPKILPKSVVVKEQKCQENNEDLIDDTLYCPKITNLKRGRPNTLQTGLLPPLSSSVKMAVELATAAVQDPFENFENKSNLENFDNKENWVSAEKFFVENLIEPSNISANINQNIEEISTNVLSTVITTNIPTSSVQINIQPVTPKYLTRIKVNNPAIIKTPMLPPKSIPKRTKTPNSCLKSNNLSSKKIIPVSIAEDEQQKQNNNDNSDIGGGRASIVRLRAQNAGMVLAKAKLFDDLTTTISPIVINNEEEIMKKSKNSRKSPRVIRTDLKTIENNIQLVGNKSRTPTRKKAIMSHQTLKQKQQYALIHQQQQQQQQQKHQSFNGDTTERILLGTLVNEGQIQMKGNRNKVTTIRNISNNRNLTDSPNNKRTLKMHKKNNLATASVCHSPRKFLRNAR